MLNKIAFAYIVLALLGCPSSQPSSTAQDYPVDVSDPLRMFAFQHLMSETNNFDEVLGTGFDRDLRVYRKNRCVSGNLKFEGQERSSVEFLHNKSAQYLTNNSTGSGSAKIAALGKSRNASVDYFMRVSSNSYTSSNVIKFEYERGVLSLVNQKPNLDLFKKDARTHRYLCGTSFVNKVRVGVQLYVAVNIHYLSFDAAAEAKVKFKVKKHKKTFSKKIFDEEKSIAIVRIDLHQIGGNTSQLDNIFKKSNRSKWQDIIKRFGISSYQRTCETKAEDFDDCVEGFINKVLHYANTNLPNSLKKTRYDGKNLNTVTRNLSILGPINNKYSELGFFIEDFSSSEGTLSEEVQKLIEIKNALVSQLEYDLGLLQRAGSLASMHVSLGLSKDHVNALNRLIDNLEKRNSLLKAGLAKCDIGTSSRCKSMDQIEQLQEFGAATAQIEKYKPYLEIEPTDVAGKYKPKFLGE